MAQVKAVVLALNELNENADDSLIETDAREALWQVIQESAAKRSFNIISACAQHLLPCAGGNLF